MVPLLHHPIVTEIKCYPDLGQKLTYRHVGQSIVRIFPFWDSASNQHFWYYMPYGKDVEKIRQCALKLLRLEGDGDEMYIVTAQTPLYQDEKLPQMEELIFSKDWNDGNWANVEDLVRHILK